VAKTMLLDSDAKQSPGQKNGWIGQFQEIGETFQKLFFPVCD